MGIRIYPDENDPTIVRWDIEGRWTWDDYHHARTDSDRIGQGVERFDIVCDMRRAGPVPVSPATLHIKHGLDNALPAWGICVLVGPDAFVRVMVSLVQRVLPKARNTFFLADSVEQAHEIISRARARQTT
ncbi:MAG: hypothetical protein SF029_10875 [bacterium]|nr:hypothetical protein [bacterium]